jgi:cytidylate kinase
MPYVESTATPFTEEDLDRCRVYLDYQHDHPKLPSDKGVWPPPGPAVTIAPQTGSGAPEIARQLAAILERDEPEGSSPWGVFDRELAKHALEEHHVPARVLELMPEDRRSYFDDVLDEMMGLRPPSWELVPMMVKTIQHMVEVGHVILLGYGGGIVTRGTPGVFHVRLVAPLPRRIERVQQIEHLAAKQAAKFIEREDLGRSRYVKGHFHTDVEDDLNYHLVLNTDLMSLSDAAGLIAEGARKCFHNGSHGGR